MSGVYEGSRRDEIEQAIQDEMLTVTFQTRADMEELTADDLANLGRFVQEVAAEKRARLS